MSRLLRHAATVFALAAVAAPLPVVSHNAQAAEVALPRLTVQPSKVVDSTGRAWASRSGFVGGKYSNSYQNKRIDIAGTTSDDVYRAELAGVTGWSAPVPSGTYAVTLKMREAWWTAPGQRVFDVYAEGRPALRGVDIFKAVGRQRAYDQTFDVAVSDGRLNLDFVASRDKALVSAIEVVRTVPSTTTTPPVAPPTTPTTPPITPPVTPMPAETMTTLRPEQSAGHVPGSERGQYLWYPEAHRESVPASLAAKDSYARYTWRQIEPKPGVYDFSAIDAELADARRRGGTFGFRIMPVCAWCGAADALPSDLYVSARTWSTTLSDGEVLRIPDWNDPEYLRRWDGLMQVLGKRYDANPALSYVDSGGYGNWGEGHNWPYESQYPRPQGQRSATVATANAIVSSVVRNFPTSYVLHSPNQLRADEAKRYDPAATWANLKASLALSRRVGMRNDCLGGGSIQEFALQILREGQANAVAENVALEDRPLDRWRVAPVVTEWCDSINPRSTDGTFAQGAQQVPELHVSLLSNGNFKGTLLDYSAAEQRAFLTANELAGYRYAIPTTSLTEKSKDGSVVVTATWVNAGVAPTYRSWTIEYTLRTTDGAVVARGTSALDLKALLGAGSSRIDTVSMSTAKVAAGEYHLHIRVVDAANYRSPMTLGSGTRTADGSHRMGTVRLAGA